MKEGNVNKLKDVLNKPFIDLGIIKNILQSK
jgi:hypothetical protein